MIRDFKAESAVDLVFVGRLIAREEQAWRELRVKYNGLFLKIVKFKFHVPDQELPDVWERLLEHLTVNNFKRLKSYSGKVIFAAWLRRVITNLAIDWLRGQKAVPVLYHDDDETYEPGSGETISEILDRKKADFCLQKALAALSPERRRIYELVLVEQRSYTEVAAIEKINISTVGTRWLRTRAAISSMVLDCCGMGGNNKRLDTSL
jgi:RNA polymerase sigma factor (sigma-70 family)